MRLAEAARRASSRKIAHLGDRQKIQFNWSEPIEDPFTKRIVGKEPHSAEITGSIEELTEDDLKGTNLSRLDRKITLDAYEVEEEGFELTNEKVVILNGKNWNIIKIVTGPYAIPNEYTAIIRKT